MEYHTAIKKKEIMPFVAPWMDLDIITLRDKSGAWDEHANTLLYLRQITNKDLLFSTGNSAQSCVMIYMRKESQKE